MRARLTADEIITWETLFPALVNFIRANPEAGETEIIQVAVASELVTETRVKEWLDQTILALWHDGTLSSNGFTALLAHMRGVALEALESIGARVISYSKQHPLPFMIVRAREELTAEIARWEAEPEQLPNIERELALEQLNTELVELET